MTMQLLIQQTTEFASFDGATCRKWKGFGPDGGAFDVWVHTFAPLDDMAFSYVADHAIPVKGPSRFALKTIEFSRDAMSSLVAAAVEQSRGLTRESRTQAALDRLIESAHADGEDVLAFALLLVQASRCAGEEDIAAAVTALSGAIADREKKRPVRGEPDGPSATAAVSDAASEGVVAD